VNKVLPSHNTTQKEAHHALYQVKERLRDERDMMVVEKVHCINGRDEIKMVFVN